MEIISFCIIEYAVSRLALVVGSINCMRSVIVIEDDKEIGFLTSIPVASNSTACLYHTCTDTTHVVPVKFAESTALVFATKDNMVVHHGIHVPVIVAPFTHPVVSATVIFADPFVALIFCEVSISVRRTLLVPHETLVPSVINDFPALPA